MVSVGKVLISPENNDQTFIIRILTLEIPVCLHDVTHKKHKKNLRQHYTTEEKSDNMWHMIQMI